MVRHSSAANEESHVTIRPERSEDHAAITEVNRLAFGQENEPRLVAALRNEEGFDPRLSLVAEQDGRVVGHILFTPISIEGEASTTSAQALAPMAVTPDLQGRGIGSALVRQGLEACRRLGHSIVVVLGHAEYYPRFGFQPARPHGILPPFDAPDEAWMVQALEPGALQDVGGIVRYSPPFADV